ncbi:hypothetical protein [Salinigranum marinum]|uniref:SMP-30/gluconolactonase/LRE family protein n=1 Tax=Salinigranum marinum TaxID=1515595 RepID=UPI002989A6C7|nr:hypothetical protein [Salinigranum marinum]
MAGHDSLTRRAMLATGVTALVGVAGCGAQSGTTDSPTAAETDTATAAATDTPTDTATVTDTPADTTTPGAGADVLVSVPGERVPENLGFDADGNLLFGITAGEVRRLSSERLGETDLTLDDTEQVATLPGAIGVEAGPAGSVYVAVPGEQSGVWRVPSGGEPSLLGAIDGFPNDLVFDAARDRVLVTESQNGTVSAVSTGGEVTTWLDDDRLDTEGFGANGLTVGADGSVFVAVTQAPDETGRLVEVPTNGDGTAGEPTTFYEGGELFGADGITARGDDVYVAVNRQNRVVTVSPDGAVEAVADADDGLVFPSDVLFGTTEPYEETLFVCNFANQSPEEGGVLRTRP